MAVDQEYRAGLIWPILVKAAAQEVPRELLTYGEVAQQIGVHHRVLSYPLGHIQAYCISNGLPPLTALVVNKQTRMQGNGYTAGQTGDLADVEAVFAFDWTRIPNPFSQMPIAEVEGHVSRLMEHPDEAKEIFRLVADRGATQRIFREAVYRAYDGQCAMCGMSFVEVLEAAHIKPWSGTSPEIRIDPRNGILLCATHHRLLDAGWLCIDADLTVHFSDTEQKDGPYYEADKAVAALHGTKLKSPHEPHLRPSKVFLQERFEEWTGG
jgi:putative restriction endonuclease